MDQPKGTDVIREGIRKLKFNQQLKKAEGAKPTKVELTISVDGVTIQEPKSKVTFVVLFLQWLCHLYSVYVDLTREGNVVTSEE